MIKGLAITPPILGRISIGRVVEKNGKRLPEKDDQFTITTQIQQQNGWLKHPFDEELREQSDNKKLRSIPVQMLFNDPELNLRAEYSLFDRKNGRPLCVGNGVTCRRVTEKGITTLSCPSPEGCELAKAGCKPYGRLNVKIGDSDELGSFIFRTTGFNSIRTLAARLKYYQAVSGDIMSCMKLELKLRGKSTTQSHRSAIYYVDLETREGITLEATINEAKQTKQKREASGFNQQALDDAARNCFANASFEFDAEEVPAIVEEFYPEDEASTNTSLQQPMKSESKPSLLDKLESKAI